MKKFILLQINDASFPVGAYAHSNGLETYIQKGIVNDKDTAFKYIINKLKYGILYTDLMAIKLVYKYRDDLSKILHIEELMEAGKVPYEVREGNKKMASRFLKTLKKLNYKSENNLFSEYSKVGRISSYSIVYGIYCCSMEIDFMEAIENFLYAQASGMVINCVKTIPLSQTDGQIMLSNIIKKFEDIKNNLINIEEELFMLSTVGFDIRCMEHECLYSRLYMS